jgi:hypothetical protein
MQNKVKRTGTLKKASIAASSGYWLGSVRVSVQKFVRPLLAPRASAPLRPAPGASTEDGAAPNDPLAFDLRARPFRRAP